MNNALAERSEVFWNFPNVTQKKSNEERIAVLGLGYVGLPLSLAIADAYEHVVGFDCDVSRVSALRLGHDRTNEVDDFQLNTTALQMSANPRDLSDATVFVVTVPTPVDQAKRPDLSPLRAACRDVAQFLTKGSIVVFESTVYPGATEEVCIPELAQHTDLIPEKDFFVAYSPERINPGDRVRGLGGVVKIVSANDPDTLDRVARVYEKVVPAGVHKAPNIKVAEAAKVFENTQRDVNIGLTNELAILCDHMGLRTQDVLEASGTKWNALPFRPGLVGGHCIGVDPYYLLHKADELGSPAHILRAAREVNEAIPRLLAQKIIRHIMREMGGLTETRVGILGITFKENVPDLRNSKILDLIDELRNYGIEPTISDPVVDTKDPRLEGYALVDFHEFEKQDVMVLAVAHDDFLGLGSQMISERTNSGGLILDVKSRLDPTNIPCDRKFWSL